MTHSSNIIAAETSKSSKTVFPLVSKIVNNSYFWVIAAIFIISIFGIKIQAQNQKTFPQSQIYYSGSSNASDISSFTQVKPEETHFSQQKQNLLTQLEAARTSNNIQLKEQLESQLDGLDNTASVQLIPNSNTMGAATGNTTPVEGDYNTSPILPGSGIWSSATQTVAPGLPHAGRIWTATAIYSANVSDTCKLFYSDDGGQSWVFAYYFWFFNNVDFRANELDMELVYDGSNMWIFGTAGCYDGTATRTNSLYFRINLSTNAYNGYTLTWPGYNTTLNRYYNPRITSDNSNYTTATYIYLSSSFDSTYGSNQHYNRLKYAHVVNPFAASLTINYSMPQGSSFYWSTPSTSAIYLWTDIAYCRSATNLDRVMTVFSAPGSGVNNQYFAWSDDYGVTVVGSNILSELNVNRGTRMAFNGAGNYTGMITYVRQYNGADWDANYARTTNSGSTWTTGYIDVDLYRVRSVDLIAVRGAANSFKVGYTKELPSGTNGYYSAFNGTTFNSGTVITAAGVDTVYTKVIAGYRSGTDECFAIYSMGTGGGLYESRLCQTTIGITNNNNEIPSSFNLAQNYPNPFNPTTNIRFGITGSSAVKLIVYDITGKIVETLVNESLNAGSYSYNFNASNIASGVYFYRIDVKSTDGKNNFSDVKKMMLIK